MENKIIKDLQIDTANIKQSYIEQPAKYAWWAIQAIKAQNLLEKKKQECDIEETNVKKILRSRIDQEVRETMNVSGSRITEGKIEALVNTDERYISGLEDLNKLKSEMLSLQENYLMLVAAREAMEQRKEMLISLGAQMRYEDSNSQQL